VYNCIVTVVEVVELQAVVVLTVVVRVVVLVIVLVVGVGIISVDITTRYGLEGLGIESRWG